MVGGGGEQLSHSSLIQHGVGRRRAAKIAVTCSFLWTWGVGRETAEEGEQHVLLFIF